MSETRPPSISHEAKRVERELSEVAHNDIEWRTKLAENIGEIRATVSYTQLLLEAHQKLDDERFRAIHKQFGGDVISGNALETKMEGAGIALKAALGVLALFASIGGFVIWLMSLGGGKVP